MPSGAILPRTGSSAALAASPRCVPSCPDPALSLDGACLRGKCEKDTVLGYEFMRRFNQLIVERLEATRMQLLDLYGDDDAR